MITSFALKIKFDIFRINNMLPICDMLNKKSYDNGNGRNGFRQPLIDNPRKDVVSTSKYFNSLHSAE